MDNTVAASLADLAWMVGPWRGALGAQTVEESWSEGQGGVMSTMIRLGSETTVDMIELIAIRQNGDSLVLHLRQFGPDLSLRHSDDMALAHCGEGAVRFVSPGAAIEALAYTQQGDDGMLVEVTVTGGSVLAAGLQRP